MFGVGAGLRRAVRSAITSIFVQAGYYPNRLDVLTRLADLKGSDKGNLHDAHLYTRVYHRFFNALRLDTLTVLELGLSRPDIEGRRTVCGADGATSKTATRAPSLEMWRVYFPNARIFGFDIDDFTAVRIPNCEIMRGDMSSRNDLGALVTRIGGPIDILIDDGSHASHHQQIALGFLFPYVRPSGLYIIEDLHWQDPKLERPGACKTRDILRRFQIDGKFNSGYLSDDEQRYVEDYTSDVRLFDSQSIRIDSADALAILRKK